MSDDPLKLAKDILQLRIALQAALDAIEHVRGIIYDDEEEAAAEQRINESIEVINGAIHLGTTALSQTGALH